LKAGEQQAISHRTIPVTGLPVHLRGDGWLKVFRTVDPHGNADYGATRRLDLTATARQQYAERGWMGEVSRRPLSNLRAVSAVSFGSNLPSATPSVWRCAPTSDWNSIAGALGFPFSR
jgi:hypothetical protein